MFTAYIVTGRTAVPVPCTEARTPAACAERVRAYADSHFIRHDVRADFAARAVVRQLH